MARIRTIHGSCCAHGCDREAEVATGLGNACNMHYLRWRIHGSFELPERQKSRFCICTNCGKSFDRGYAINARRAKRSQFCSTECFTAQLAKRASDRFEARVWARVDIRGPDECWLWNGRRAPFGYGLIDIGNRPHAASRVIYKMVTGEDPPSVCHRCDNPPCCNPRHLFGGTQADNVQDMIAKGRMRHGPPKRGTESNMCRLSEQAVLEIFESKLPQRELAKRHGVSQVAIGHIKRGKNWGWLTGGANG